MWNSTENTLHFHRKFGEAQFTFNKEQITVSFNDGFYDDQKTYFAFLINFNNRVIKEDENTYKLGYHTQILLTQYVYLSELKKESKYYG